MAKQKTVKKTSAKVSKITRRKYELPKERVLSETQRYWQTAEERAKGLIAEQIVSQIPFNPELVFEFNEKMDNRYDDVLEDLQEYDELPEDPRELAEIIFCEYLRRLIRDLANDLASWE